MNYRFLLIEGRKEDLRKKYENKFKYNDLDFILNISDLVDFNHKYTDFILKNLHTNPINFNEDVESAVDYVKMFDKYQSKLPKKDINQYKSIKELSQSLDIILQQEKEKEEEKRAEKEVKKIYEDDQFLIVKPKTELASCKYGANTKWCVTSKGSGHFGRYTSGNQSLYFIINKKFSTHQSYSKVAVHISDSNTKSFWDAQDYKMGQREIDVLNYAYPELFEAIDEDYQKTSSPELKFLSDVLNSYKLEVLTYKFKGIKIEFSISGFNSEEEISPFAAKSEILIKVNDKIIDAYDILSISKLKDKDSFITNFNFSGLEPRDNWDYINLDLERWSTDILCVFIMNPERTSSYLKQKLASGVLNHILGSPEFKQKFFGTDSIWRPGRFGYKFLKNKGLIKSLIDYLDNNEVGTKLDFLTKIGKLRKDTRDGKTVYYSQSGREANERGYFSTFFSSAKSAGIIDYEKSGKKYYLIKGPNFEQFKSGKLVSI